MPTYKNSYQLSCDTYRLNADDFALDLKVSIDYCIIIPYRYCVLLWCLYPQCRCLFSLIDFLKPSKAYSSYSLSCNHWIFVTT